MAGGDGGKRKKFHDKDKYYRLAKEQGLRSRAAFKLVQINRKFSILDKVQTAVLDLCAAPGGWTQICARTCPKQVGIIAVDILPIRSLGKTRPNVTTLIGDITTDKCKADIRRAVSQLQIDSQHVRNKKQAPKLDVVLHDGAPNVGAEYSKDAYEQNEIALHALKCATQHLEHGGTFVTKLYRSKDYASYVYVCQQLFDNVTAFKPKASRQQSAEIFLICQQYKAPQKLDPRLLDPKYVFESIDGQTTGGVIGGTIAGDGASAIHVFHKNWDKQSSTRKRGGYDMEYYDATMRHVVPVQDFIAAKTLKDAIQTLSTCTGFSFDCHVCHDYRSRQNDTEEPPPSCHCQFYQHHAHTTQEIKECLADLKVLNKNDFKGLLVWRTKILESLSQLPALGKEGTARKGEDDDLVEESSSDEDDDSDPDEDEDEIQAEIRDMKKRRLREKKRKKKKERALAAKRRRRAALGMDLNAIDVPEHDKIFSLASISSKGDLDAAAEVDLDKVTDDQLFGKGSDDEEVVIGKVDEDGSGESDGDEDDEDRLRRRRERDLDAAYDLYLQTTKDGSAKSGTKMAKRSKKLQRIKVAEEAAEDQEMALATPAGIGGDTKAYIEMLKGPKDSDSDSDGSSEDEDDGFHDDPLTPEEHAARKGKKKAAKVKATGDSKNPLIHEFADESKAVKTARWFSNPLFASIGEAAQSAQVDVNTDADEEEMMSDDSDEGSDSSVGSEDSDDGNAKSKNKKIGISADEVLAMIPKSDKQKRHERRIKAMAREERKKARRAKKLGEAETDFDLAPADADDSDDDGQDNQLMHLSEAEKKKVLEARDLIKAGMGKMDADAEGNDRIEVIPEGEADRPLPVMDDRKYDSEHEDYDSDDYARTLALGTMMLRRSKEKALVDASYNRYAWNDPADLPEWFVDDETKHYRPQLPIPPALLAKMKEKMMALSTRPIAKVAEARARKSKRARAKLAAAKKQAEAVAKSSDMTEAMKLKAISKALRSQETRKPGKTYVVAKKGRGMKAGGKGVKVVDKRMRSDKRAMERVEKKKRKGKQNGLVGSKKRRHHR